jgi:hypothetical protein
MNEWIVGGDDVLSRFVISRPAGGGCCSREWIMDGELVKLFDDKETAITRCKNLNKQELRAANMK